MANAVIIPVYYNTTEGADIYSDSNAMEGEVMFSDTETSSFSTSTQFWLPSVGGSYKFNADAKVSAVLSASGGMGLSGSYHHDENGTVGKLSMSLLETNIALKTYFEVSNGLKVTKKVPLFKMMKLVNVIIIVGGVPLSIIFSILPQVEIELSVARSLEFSVTAGVNMNGIFTVTGSTYDQDDFLSTNGSTFNINTDTTKFTIAEASCTISGKVGLISDVTLSIGIPFTGYKILYGVVAPQYSVTLSGYSPPLASANCDCENNQTLSTGVTLGMVPDVPMLGGMFTQTTSSNFQLSVSTPALLESCHTFPDLFVCGSCNGIPTIMPTVQPDTASATNIESIYSEWSCDTSGQPLTDPCGNPMWRGGDQFDGFICVENSISISQLHSLSGKDKVY